MRQYFVLILILVSVVNCDLTTSNPMKLMFENACAEMKMVWSQLKPVAHTAFEKAKQEANEATIALNSEKNRSASLERELKTNKRCCEQIMKQQNLQKTIQSEYCDCNKSRSSEDDITCDESLEEAKRNETLVPILQLQLASNKEKLWAAVNSTNAKEKEVSELKADLAACRAKQIPDTLDTEFDFTNETYTERRALKFMANFAVYKQRMINLQAEIFRVKQLNDDLSQQLDKSRAEQLTIPELKIELEYQKSERLIIASSLTREKQERAKAEKALSFEQLERLKAQSVLYTEQSKRLKAEGALTREAQERLKADTELNLERKQRLKAQNDTNTERKERLKADTALNAERQERRNIEIALNTERKERLTVENECNVERNKCLNTTKASSHKVMRLTAELEGCKQQSRNIQSDLTSLRQRIGNISEELVRARGMKPCEFLDNEDEQVQTCLQANRTAHLCQLELAKTKFVLNTTQHCCAKFTQEVQEINKGKVPGGPPVEVFPPPTEAMRKEAARKGKYPVHLCDPTGSVWWILEKSPVADVNTVRFNPEGSAEEELRKLKSGYHGWISMPKLILPAFLNGAKMGVEFGKLRSMESVTVWFTLQNGDYNMNIPMPFSVRIELRFHDVATRHPIGDALSQVITWEKLGVTDIEQMFTISDAMLNMIQKTPMIHLTFSIPQV